MAAIRQGGALVPFVPWAAAPLQVYVTVVMMQDDPFAPDLYGPRL